MTLTGPLTKLIGESMHHHHHDHAHLAHRPGGVDLAYYLFIRPLQALHHGQSGPQSGPLGSARARLPQLLGARLAALGEYG